MKRIELGDSRGGTGSPEALIEFQDTEVRNQLLKELFARNIKEKKYYLA